MPGTSTTTPASDVGTRSASGEEITEGSQSLVLPKTFQRAIDQIMSLESLPAGWDSYRGNQVSPAATRRAVAFLTMLVTHADHPIEPPIVGPSAAGAVVLQWEPHDREVVVRLEADGGDYYVARRDAEDVIDEGDVGSLEAAVKRIAPYLE